MKYKTRDKDYSGCNPEIAELLKKGKEVWCEVWGDDESDREELWLTAFISCGHYKYETEEGPYRDARPIPVKLRYKKASEIIKWLEDKGVWYDHISRQYIWIDEKNMERRFSIYDIHGISGGDADCVVAGNYPEEWLEEVTE